MLAEVDQPDTEHLQMLQLPERLVQTIEYCPDLLRFSGPENLASLSVRDGSLVKV